MKIKAGNILAKTIFFVLPLRSVTSSGSLKNRFIKAEIRRLSILKAYAYKHIVSIF